MRDAILARPYAGLKTRMGRKAREEASRAAKTKAIEELGCPVDKAKLQVNAEEYMKP